MGHWKAIGFCTFIAFGGFLFGYDIGVISGCLIMPDFINRFGEVGEDGKMFLSAVRQSEITSLLSAGTFVGALGQAFTSDRFGRRGSIFFWTALFTIGTAVQTGAETSVAQLIVGRFIAGLGVGALSAIVPLFNGESAPKHLRGTCLVLYQLMIIIGLFLSYVLDLATSGVENSASWRVPVGLQMVWGIIILGGIYLLPESPRHYLNRNDEKSARESLASLNDCALDDPIIQEMLDELLEGLKAENEGGKATWAECFSKRNKLYLRTINGIMIQFLQQLNGQNFYYYYGDTFFQSAGSEISPFIIQVILGAVSVAGTIPALYLIETWGRRRSLLLGAVLEGTCALIAGAVGHTLLAPKGTPPDQLTPTEQAGGRVLIAFGVLHVLSFSIFWGPVPWVYLGESFPLRVRPKSIALGAASNWLWNFMLGFFAPRIAEVIGPLILFIFMGMLIVAIIYVYFFIPETKGLSLEQVDELYASGVKPWNSASWEPTHGSARATGFHETAPHHGTLKAATGSGIDDPEKNGGSVEHAEKA